MEDQSIEQGRKKLVRVYDGNSTPPSMSAAQDVVKQYKAIPPDAALCEATRNVPFGAFDLVFAHEDFEPVPSGQKLPVVELHG